jgi:hypothetical protein
MGPDPKEDAKMDPTTTRRETEIEDEATAGASDDEADEKRDDLSEQELEELLTQAIECFADEGEMPRAHIRTFEDAGVLTMNRGLVVRIGDAEFQLTIVRSR